MRLEPLTEIGLMEMATVKAVAHAKLAEINGRFLTFDVKAHHGAELIGKGRVVRALVKHARFAEKTAAKSGG